MTLKCSHTFSPRPESEALGAGTAMNPYLYPQQLLQSHAVKCSLKV